MSRVLEQKVNMIRSLLNLAKQDVDEKTLFVLFVSFLDTIPLITLFFYKKPRDPFGSQCFLKISLSKFLERDIIYYMSSLILQFCILTYWILMGIRVVHTDVENIRIAPQ